MDAIEFAANYKKYVIEIASVTQDNLKQIVEDLRKLNPYSLVTPKTSFPNEEAARGFVWSLFIDAVNKYSHQPITIDIQEINSIEDIELFFALLCKERINFNPDFPFSDYINEDVYGNKTVKTFSEEESKRLDILNDKCWEIAEKENVSIYQISMRIQRLFWGEPKKKRSSSK